MNRIAYIVLRSGLQMPFWFYNICRMGRENDTHTMQEKYDYLRARVKTAISRGNVTIEVTGTEHLPEEDGFILFPNHQGLFDIVALLIACPRHLSPVAKKELGNIILIKQIMRMLKGILIDREDIKAALEVIKTMSENVKKGQNYIVFAEGTRSRNGNTLLPFKGGTFKSAVKAKCPIVPVALIDSFKPFDIPSIKKEVVQLHFLEPLTYEEYNGLKTTEIAQIVHDRIQKKIDENI